MNFLFLQSWQRITSSRVVRFCVILIFIGAILFLAACGKKGLPVPPIGT